MDKILSFLPSVVKSAVLRKLVQKVVAEQADKLADFLIEKTWLDAADKAEFSAHVSTDLTALVFRAIDK